MSKEPIKIFIDFETQSNNDIRLGVNHYMSDPEFRAYLLSYSIDGKEIETIDPRSNLTLNQSKKAEKLRSIIKSGNYLVISHNTNFDVNVWNKIFPELQIDFEKTYDTSWICRVLNIPANLDAACKFFGIGGKDLEGKKTNSKYYKVIDISEIELEKLVEYNRQDVEALIDLYDIVSTLPKEYLEGNKEIYKSVQSQNEIKIDNKFLFELLKLRNSIISLAEKKALKEFPTCKKSGKKELVSIAYSANEIKKYLNREGLEGEPSIDDYYEDLGEILGITEKPDKIKTISKNKIQEEINSTGLKLTDKAKTLIDLYRVLQSKGLSKYDTFYEYLKDSKDNVIRDFQISHGAHTGRPAGRGLQLHNVSRPPKSIENFTSQTVIKAINQKVIEENYLEATQYLSSLIWACMIPDKKGHVIGRYDLSAIEPRVGAFLRNDKKTLELYRNADLGKGKDEYTIFGERMNFPENISRQLSKVIILAACYGMGSNALRASCVNVGLPDMGESKAKSLLSSYHTLNPTVKKSWYELEAKFKLAIASGYSVYNSLEFKRVMLGNKKFIAVILPSGRAKFYADCGISANGKILYNDSRLGKIELRPYLLYENLVQASATDVLFLKAMKVEKLKNVKVKLTIYDELIVSTLPKNVKAIRKIMAEEEAAYPNMPLSFKGGESSTFWKGDKV